MGQDLPTAEELTVSLLLSAKEANLCWGLETRVQPTQPSLPRETLVCASVSSSGNQSPGASLVVISGSLLYWPIQVASVLGSPLPGACVPRWGSSSLWPASHPGHPSRPAWCQTGGCLRLAFVPENVSLLIIQISICQHTEHRHSLSPLCHLLTHM